MRSTPTATASWAWDAFSVGSYSSSSNAPSISSHDGIENMLQFQVTGFSGLSADRVVSIVSGAKISMNAEL